MDFFEKYKDEAVDISISTKDIMPEELLDKYFSFDDIEEDNEEDCYTVIYNTKISRDKFYEFLYEFSKLDMSFEVNVESFKRRFNENYIFHSGNDYILKEYVPEEYCNKSGMKHLLGIIFHTQREKILLEELE